MHTKILIAFVSLLSPMVFGQIGNPVFNYSIADNRVVVSEFVEFEGLTADQIFINSLLYAIDQGSRELENIEKIDFRLKRFVIKQQVLSTTYASTGTLYKYTTQFQIDDNTLSFLSHNITFEAKTILGEVRSTPFERLDPDKKNKDKVYLDEFISGNTRFLEAMFEFIKTNEYPAVTHWDELIAGKLVKGMNKTECTLLCGKPVNIRDTGTKIRWMFNNDFIVFFENGVITSIIK
jgi:hypothetical protein